MPKSMAFVKILKMFNQWDIIGVMLFSFFFIFFLFCVLRFPVNPRRVGLLYARDKVRCYKAGRATARAIAHVERGLHFLQPNGGVKT